MAGSSNLTSWDRTATASFGPSPISSATSSGQPTTSRSTSGKRSGVANAARPSTTTVSKPSSRARRTSERATSTPPTTTSRGRTGKTSMNSERPAELDGPRQPAPERGLRRPSTSVGVELGRHRACRSSRPSSWTTSSAAGGAPSPGCVRPNSAGGESAGSGVMTAEPCPPAPIDPRAASITTAGATGSTSTSIVPPQARPDVPGLLVADPVADDPGVAGLRRARSISSAAAPSTQPPLTEPAIRPSVGVQQDRALGSRRRPERPDDDGPADVAPPSRLPGRQGVEQFLHRSGLGADGSIGLATDDGGWRADRRAGRSGEGRVRGGLAPPSRVAGPHAAEDLAEPLQRRRPSRPAGSRRCRGRRRASRRRAAGSRACRPAG